MPFLSLICGSVVAPVGTMLHPRQNAGFPLMFPVVFLGLAVYLQPARAGSPVTPEATSGPATATASSAQPGSTVAASDLTPVSLRIGLLQAAGGATSLSITSDDAVVVTGGDDSHPIQRSPAGTIYTVTATRDGIELATGPASNTSTVGRYPFALTFAAADVDGVKVVRAFTADTTIVAWRRYRGTVTIRRQADGTLSAVDNVGLEPYLYGVLGPEMGSTAPLEALKAQAIAARTFAMKNRGRFAANGFDIDDSTRCQQYEGLDAETPATVAAVDATRGMVMTYQGGLIDAYYCTDCGGATAMDATGTRPYLQTVVDSPGPGKPDYSSASPYHDWDCVFPLAQLKTLLNKDARTQVHNFASLTLDSFDASGRIQTATIADEDGTLKTVTGAVLREVLGPDTLRSTRVTLTVKSTGDYVFHGRGWGHGLGMSQVGAVAMAQPPYNKTCQDILLHYYVGVQIGPADATSSASPPEPASNTSSAQ
ncbi:MAG: SpoIID/LytB domain-containing protein [Capsulimonadaceae bacterium]